MTIPAPRRRWFRFSLRMLFALVAVLGIWLGWNLHCVRKRDEILRELVSQSALVTYGEPLPWRSIPISWALLGARPVRNINLQFNMTQDDVRQLELWFPE